MGGKGVQVRANSIRVTFTLDGRQQHRTLIVNGAPMAPTPANVRYAERLAAEIRDKIRLGLFVLADYFPASGEAGLPTTIEQQVKDWIGAQRIATSTKAGYESACRFWAAALPGRAIRSLKLSDILTAIAQRPDLSGKTINNYVSVLREALALAVADGVLQENVADKVPRAKHQKEPPDPFTREEAESVLARLAAHHPGQVHNLVEFWAWTGLRTSELFGLQWANVDLAGGSILVAEALVRGERKATTKTAVARTVKLNSRALAALQRQRAHTHLAGGAVFQDPRYGTGWIDERAFRRSFWEPTLKALGLRYRRPYQLRHTYATAMLMAGMTPAFCAKQLGHSVEMFLTTYSRWIDGAANDREMARLEATLMPTVCPKSNQGPAGP